MKFPIILLTVALSNVIEIRGRGIDLKACDDKIFNCNCGSSGYRLHFPIKQCTFFYRWKPSCKPCDDIQEDSFCSKYANCQECSESVDRCVRCPDNRYGQWCSGVCQCMNSAICTQGDGGCQCLSGFSGRYCEIKDNPTCPAPEVPLNGKGLWSATNVGDSVSYSCDPGYVLIGTSVRTCTTETKWSQHTPHCEKTCPLMQLTEHLTADVIPHGEPGENQFAKSMNFKCSEGYEVVGPKVITCLSNGAWDGSLPRCATSCSALMAPPNGLVTYTDHSLKEGTVARVFCNKNFVLFGHSEITCLVNATWSHQLPKCEKVIYCSDPGVQPFVRVQSTPGIGGDFSQGTRLSYSCSSDYVLIGLDIIECKDGGQWSADPPACINVLDKEVTCESTGTEILLQTKAQLRINCPSGCNQGNIWGTGIYKRDSRVCAAAMHAGMIQNDGGSVYLVNNGNYTQFSPSTSNGIKSKRSRGSAGSFRFEYVDDSEDAKCPLGWSEVQNKCLIYVEKAIVYRIAVNMCKNLAATVAATDDGQIAKTQLLLKRLENDKGSRRLWAGNKKRAELPVEAIDVRIKQSNVTASGKVNGGSQIKFRPIATTTNGTVSDENCTSLDVKMGIVEEDCDNKLSFMCETNVRELIIQDEDCVNPGSIDNGSTETDRTIDGMFVVNSTIKFSCNAVHYLQGPRIITCLSNNTWSAEPPKCIKVTTCQEPLKINNGVYALLPALTGRSATSGSMSADQSMSVIAGRNIPHRRPVALSIPAYSSQTLPTAAQNIIIPSGRHQVGARVQFSCESQFYNLMGSSTRTCMADGQWSGRQPTCQPVCGISSSPRAPFIVNGQPTKVGQWPWQVAMARKEIDDAVVAGEGEDNFNWFLFCGASLLTESWVVTAAHCVTYSGTNTIVALDDMRLYVGKYYRNDTLDDDWVQMRTIEEIHVYPDFNPVLFDGDLALVRLSKPVQLTSRVTPVCLPDKQSGISERHLQAGTMGVVTGWGTDEKSQYSSTLLQADIPVVSSAECEEGYKDAGVPLSVSGNMFCAGFSEKGKDDACSGDSGGPFVVAEGSGIHERWYLEGVVSWGSPIGCGNARQYGGYSKISSFLEWIMQFI